MNLKPSILLLIIIPLHCYGKLGPKWIENAPIVSEIAKSNPTKDTVIDLGRKLISVDDYNSGTPEETGAINIISTTLLSIPNHTKYFEDELESERKLSGLHPGQSRSTYDELRVAYFRDILPHLPSPESIKSLCGYLYDDRDKVEMKLVEGAPCQSGGSAGNSTLVVEGLKLIGLRNPPVKRFDYSNFNSPVPWREWYEKVKSGELPFSFVGQLVEYRFKPDGTWESVSLPESVLAQDPKPVARTSPEPSQPAPTAAVAKSPWLWLVGGFLVLAAALGWVRTRLKRWLERR